MFFGSYRAAFYAHIIAGPIALLIGSLLLISGRQTRYRRWHRWVGKIQIVLILGLLVPSGLVMAQQALSGPVAAAGFSLLAVATGVSAIQAVYCAVRRRFKEHQQWATRCFILLASPLLLRLINGAVIVADLESDGTYRLSAWLSWILPLAVYEFWLFRQSHEQVLGTAIFHRSLAKVERVP